MGDARAFRRKGRRVRKETTNATRRIDGQPSRAIVAKASPSPLLALTMEAAHSARQARLATLRQAKDSIGQGDSATTSDDAAHSSSSIHPFRRAFLLAKSIRGQQAANADASTSAAALIDSTTESQMLRRFRNWDPTTGQPRTGIWNTVQGIEDEVKGVQASALLADETARMAELDLKNLAPKKQNWDLRNHWEKRLRKLRKRDREARMILISECAQNTTDEYLALTLSRIDVSLQGNVSRARQRDQKQLRPRPRLLRRRQTWRRKSKARREEG